MEEMTHQTETQGSNLTPPSQATSQKEEAKDPGSNSRSYTSGLIHLSSKA